MRYQSYLAIGILSPVFVSGCLCAQASKSPTLKEQLEAQYAPETVLVVQKDGILGVAPMIIKTCAAKYQSGNLKSPDASCYGPIKDSSRMLAVGEKVNPKGVRVNLATETIAVDIAECDSCNKAVPASSYKAEIEFQFAKGYLERGNVSEIEDTIAQILSIPQADDQQSQPAQESGEVITNEDVVKMVKAKLGDAIIISTIKSSNCNFDTSVSGMVKLKEAAVSDAVILAMRDAQAAANAPANDQTNDQNNAAASDQQGDQQAGPASVPGQLNFAVSHRHSTFFNLQASGVEYYCYGNLSVLPDGTVAYDCDRTDDPSGRCDHVSFAPGSLKQAKMGFAGTLHLESKNQGKFDFYGKRDDLKAALEKIGPQVQK
jgi:hypothetical protein